jgi:hypothetical protein
MPISMIYNTNIAVEQIFEVVTRCCTLLFLHFSCRSHNALFLQTPCCVLKEPNWITEPNLLSFPEQ